MVSEAKKASALIGAPPNNDRDTNIVRVWFRGYGTNDADPSLGMIFTAKRPENYVYESKQPGMIADMVIMILVIIMSTVGRLLVRTRGKYTQFGADDWVIVVAATLAYYLSVCKYIFYPAVGLTKISIALFVRRIADRASKPWRILADIFIGTVVAFIIASEYAGSLETPPICLSIAVNSKVLGAIHTVQGLMLLSAPIIILLKTIHHLDRRCLTVLGGLLQQTVAVITNDLFYQYSGVLVWTSLDLSMGTLTACLPVLDAAIMGSWRAAKTKLSSSVRHRSGTHVLSSGTNDQFTRGTQIKSVARAQTKKEYTESIEGIMQKEEGTELAIMRTDEVRLDYETVDSNTHQPSQARSQRHARFE
ncbi:hypothetical protein B0T11DRAFT_309266 [Plectosphaerella cucumerina]|uniref:Integral membrane protein n=1 Tax=Plectosphaerella cucumerina TaxID=40658 RepID=A0A8K0TVZ1_9PEZI|nr:hypothetical protein B0T11DRAFT_309266 [Plectosphaerella cucumerina]